MKIRIWGSRGSLASAGPYTIRYGGNTACVEVVGDDGSVVILDAGSGIRRLAERLNSISRVDVFLTHLHMDHIQGLGFFGPLFRDDIDVRIWGPAASEGLPSRLARYLSPPLFPVRVRDLRSVSFRIAPGRPIRVGDLSVVAQPVVHPGPTVGYRITEGDRAMAYIPDHEPALGARRFPIAARWTSGAALASGVDVLVHDAQYTPEEQRTRVGWGHCTLGQSISLARLVGVRTLVPFHHDPAHDDARLDAVFNEGPAYDDLEVVPGREGTEIVLRA
jgi:phosphoribosyl 1,2-cyclic phosphodiesterase